MNTRQVSSFLSWHHGSHHTAVKTHALENWKWLPGVEFSIPSGWLLIITQGSSGQGCFFDSKKKIYSLRMIWTMALIWKLEAGLGTPILSCWVSEVWRYFGCPDSHSVICNFCCCNLCKNALKTRFRFKKVSISWSRKKHNLEMLVYRCAFRCFFKRVYNLTNLICQLRESQSSIIIWCLFQRSTAASKQRGEWWRNLRLFHPRLSATWNLKWWFPWLHLYMLGYVGCIRPAPSILPCSSCENNVKTQKSTSQSELWAPQLLLGICCTHETPMYLSILYSSKKHLKTNLWWTCRPAEWPHAISRCGKAHRRRPSSIHRRSQNSSGTSHGSAWDLSRRIWAGEGRSIHISHISIHSISVRSQKKILRVRNL